MTGDRLDRTAEHKLGRRGIRHPLADAHSQILVSSTSLDALTSTGWALDWLGVREPHGCAARTLVALADPTPDTSGTTDINRTAEAIRETGVAVLRVGYDRHLALGAALDPRRLTRSTRLVSLRLAAEALSRALPPTGALQQHREDS